MPSLIKKGVVVIGGPKNAGKSIMAVTVVPPTEMNTICYHDGENSVEEIRDRAIAAQEAAGIANPGFGAYVNLAKRFALNSDEILANMTEGKFPWKSKSEQGAMIGYFERTVEAIQSIPDGKCSIYVHEPADKLEASIVAWATEYSGISTRAPGGDFWREAVYPVYLGLFDILKSKGMELIILTAHEKNSSMMRGNKSITIPNKVELAVKPELYKQAALMVYLVQDPRNESGAPAGLVLKERMPSMAIVDGRWKPRRMLPRRIPNCIWFNGDEPRGSIEWYMKNGADLANPHITEQWSAQEKDFLGEFLNKVQMSMMAGVAGNEIATTAPVTDLATIKHRNEITERTDGGMTVEEAIDDILSGVPIVLRGNLRAEYESAAEGLEL